MAAGEGSVLDLEQIIDRICTGCYIGPLQVEDFSPELQSLAAKIQKWHQMMLEIDTYAAALTKGNLDVEPPLRSNYLAAGLKALHVQLNHLTWQAEQVAQGDYEQMVDYMGKFSYAFNQMTQQLKRREEQWHAQHRILQRIFDHLDSLVIVSKSEVSMPLYLNQTAQQIFGLLPGEEVNLDDPPPLLALLWGLLEQNHQGVNEAYESISERWYRTLITPLAWMNEETVILCYCSDITEQKNLEVMLTEVASTDPLTGLLNRRAYEMAASREWGRCVRRNLPISFLMIDIDFFKHYNDSFGHPQGDQCLKALARCLRNSLNRSTDVVARIGGEEFVVMLPYFTEETAWVMAEKLRQAVAEMEIDPYEGFDSQGDLSYQHITISIGLATAVPELGMQAEVLLQQADKALYLAKQRGRNQTCKYEETFESSST